MMTTATRSVVTETGRETGRRGFLREEDLERWGLRMSSGRSRVQEDTAGEDERKQG